MALPPFAPAAIGDSHLRSPRAHLWAACAVTSSRLAHVVLRVPVEPEDQSAAVITMRKSAKLPIVWLVCTSEKRYPDGRIVAGDHKSGHENTAPHANWWVFYPQKEWTS